MLRRVLVALQDDKSDTDDDSEEDEDDEAMEEVEEANEEVDQNFRLELMKVLQQKQALVGVQAFNTSWCDRFVCAGVFMLLGVVAHFHPFGNSLNTRQAGRHEEMLITHSVTMAAMSVWSP